jgi:hypothetical protein
VTSPDVHVSFAACLARSAEGAREGTRTTLVKERGKKQSASAWKDYATAALTDASAAMEQGYARAVYGRHIGSSALCIKDPRRRLCIRR